MKTFQQFILEAYDPEVQGRSQITKSGEGGRIGRKRKQTEPGKAILGAVLYSAPSPLLGTLSEKQMAITRVRHMPFQKVLFTRTLPR